MRKKVFLNWQLNSVSGWGILGLNIFLHWANDRDVMPLMGHSIFTDAVYMVDPLRLSQVSRAIGDSNDFCDRLGRKGGESIGVEATVIDGVFNGFYPSPVFGQTNIGRCIFENTKVTELDRKLAKYDALVCGSNWNADILRAHTGREVHVILEGIDPSVFCPGPKSGLMNQDNFYIFSGGKIEPRKGQDLVLLAFREFSRKHPNAFLVTTWHSPWTEFSIGVKGRLDAPLELDESGKLNVKKWVSDNGIDPARVIEIFQIPNQMMPMILREMDVALQPSRAEACTNLPVKEAMACGLPVIVAENTGMKDLIAEDNCFPLRKQSPIPDTDDWGSEGWGESDVDEIVEALELLYADHKRRKAIGTRAAEWILANRTWQRHASELKQFVLSVS
jgi:glycosyltransferase involved in cell wall biosynthesis